MLGVLGGAVAFDCGRNEAITFGRVRTVVRDIRSAARAPSTPLPLARGGPDPRALAFALSLDPRRLPAQVELLDRRGRAITSFRVPRLCGVGTVSAILPLGVPFPDGRDGRPRP
jgi:hypothetical protein